MIEQTKWFERMFEFNFPIGVLPCIIERLSGTPARMEELVHLLPKNILTVRIDNAWSLQEHAGHLFDLDELHEHRLDDFSSGAETLRPADLQNKKTFDANHNANSIENIVKMFREARSRFIQKLETFDETMLARTAIHPRLKQKMRVVDMAYFVAEHDDHHLARMRGIAKKLSS
jgi:hypothetical protein